MNLGKIPFILIALAFAARSDAQMTPPVIKAVKTVGPTSSGAMTLTIEGSDLDGTTEIVFDDPRLRSARPTIDKAVRDRVEATLKLTPGGPSGSFHVRAIGPRGISGPGRLEIARAWPVVTESEPNDGFRKPQAVAVPCTVEGNLKTATDVDLFAVEMKAGETLVAEILAARIGATLDPILTIFGPDGRELSTSDDLFGRDAGASCRILKAGRYFIQVVEANGRDPAAEAKMKPNRIYRLALGTIPLLTTVDPPGVRRGESTPVRLLGANVPAGATINPPADSPTGDVPFAVPGSNAVNLRVGDWPEAREAEPDDRPDQAREYLAPFAINGRFDPRAGGDVDHYRIKPANGRAGDYRITVHAASVGSPADPVLALLGDDAQSLAEDDDKLGRDARIERRIEPKGLLLSVREFSDRGGDRFVYRIEVEPVAGVTLSADLTARSIPRRGRIAVPIAAERKGYDGPITILPEALPVGVTGAPVTIPTGATRGLLILGAATDAALGSFCLGLTSRDVPVAVHWTFGAPGPNVEGEPLFAVAEPAALDVSLSPLDLSVSPGGEVEFKVRLDRRGDLAKGPIKVAIVGVEGELVGFEPIKDEILAPGMFERSLRLKTKPDAKPRRLTIVARAWFEGTPEGRGIVSNPVVVDLR